MHRTGGPLRIPVLRQLRRHFSVLCHGRAVDEGARHLHGGEIAQQDEIGALAGRHGTELVIELEALRAVDRDHLDGSDGIDPLLDGAAEDMVDMALRCERVRVVVVRDKHGKPRVDLVLRHTLGHLVQIAPAGPLAQHGIHAEAHLLQRVLRARRFVAAADAGSDVGVQPGAVFHHGIMACHNLAGLERFAHNGVRARVGSKNTGEVHHLPQADHAVPLHRFADILRPDGGARVLKARHGRHAGGRCEHGFERRARGILHHAGNARQAEHVADLVRVHENTGGAVRQHRPGIFAHRNHGGLHMEMAVEKTGSQEEARGVDDLRLRADAGRAVAHQSDAAAAEGDVDRPL